MKEKIIKKQFKPYLNPKKNGIRNNNPTRTTSPIETTKPTKSTATKRTNRYNSDNNLSEKKISYLTQFKRSKSQYLYDFNQNKYLDFDLINGSLIFGHTHPTITKNQKNYISKGSILPETNGLDHQLKKNLLTLYPQMSNIEFYENQIEILNTLINIVNKKIKNERKNHKGKILFLGNNFYICYNHLIKRYPHLIDLFNDFFYFLPTVDLNNLEKIIQNKNKLSFLNKIKLKNKSERIEMICFSPISFSNDIDILSSNSYDSLSIFCKENNILTVLDKTFLTLRVGLKGYHASYFIKADFFILGSAIGGGFPLYSILTKKNFSHLLEHYKSSPFFVLPYIAGITTLRYIKHKNPYDEIKIMLEYFKYKLAQDSKIQFEIKLYENYFYLLPKLKEYSALKSINHTLMNLNQYLNYHEPFSVIEKNIHQKFLNNFIMLNPNYPLVGFLSSIHDKNDIRFLIKQMENIQL